MLQNKQSRLHTHYSVYHWMCHLDIKSQQGRLQKLYEGCYIVILSDLQCN